jgi:hypothetical protein
LRDISIPHLGVFYCSVVSSDFPEFVFDFVVGRFLIGVVSYWRRFLLASSSLAANHARDAANW